MSDSIVHGIAWAGQPDLQIRCTKEWTTPAWNQPTLPIGVYLAHNGSRYAFEPTKVTCPACVLAQEPQP